jgi:hypothetical protein
MPYRFFHLSGLLHPLVRVADELLVGPRQALENLRR